MKITVICVCICMLCFRMKIMWLNLMVNPWWNVLAVLACKFLSYYFTINVLLCLKAGLAEDVVTANM